MLGNTTKYWGRAFGYVGSLAGAIWTLGAPSWAVLPSGVQEGDRVPWSQVVADPFDGKIVYDKDFHHSFAIVSTWSAQEIRATLVERNAIVVGTRQVQRQRNVCVYDAYHRSRNRHGKNEECVWRTEYYYETEPITQDRLTSPTQLMFSIYGQVYTYSQGPVPDNLAQALAYAPTGDMYIRAVFENGTYRTMRIGPNTVAAWREVFRKPKPQPPNPARP
jgi:hypothetical protein